jgi:hypothetical protein
MSFGQINLTVLSPNTAHAIESLLTYNVINPGRAPKLLRRQ